MVLVKKRNWGESVVEWSGCLFVQAVCVLDPSVQALASPITILNTQPFSRKYSNIEIKNTKYRNACI